jgi:hypothetical protein
MSTMMLTGVDVDVDVVAEDANDDDSKRSY